MSMFSNRRPHDYSMAFWRYCATVVASEIHGSELQRVLQQRDFIHLYEGFRNELQVEALS
ncbi:hypothetical protein [Bradyrhizobium sp. B120]|uniref:hypothetical protein n=1 Tax=Bradyrhizobium sp. B120 TaxID=3410088 RepID=UPI003B980A8E